MKRTSILLAALCCLSLSSCIEIIQDITYNKDKSGSCELLVDFSGMKSLIDSKSNSSGFTPYSNDNSTDSSNGIMGLSMFDTDTDPETKKRKQDSLDKVMQERFGNIEGVSNVKYINDSANYRTGISYQFKDNTALNAVLATRDENSMLGSQMSYSPAVFKFNSKANKLTYTDIKVDKLPAGMESMSLFFSMMTYTLQVNFDEQVKSCSYKDARITNGGHTVIISRPLSELFVKGSSADFTVKLK